MISKLSKIAASGNQPANAERDLHVILNKLTIDFEIEEIPVRMWDHKNSRIVAAKMPILMPDKMAEAIWMTSKELFKWIFLGDMSRSEVADYWNHVHSTSKWFQDHPAASYPREGLIPLSLYGDEVNTYKNSEIGVLMVLGWTSDFAYSRAPLNRYLLLTAYSEYISSDFTYRDVMGAVSERIKRMVDINESFPWSGEYNFMFSSNQGDLKFLLQKHYIHLYQNNEFCSWCHCLKTDPAGDASMTLGDMRSEARHRSTCISHDEYMNSTTPETSSL